MLVLFYFIPDGSLVASEDSTQNARYVFESGNLRIQNALTTDSGQFMCEAVNTKGAINITAVLNVYGKPTFSLKNVISTRGLVLCVLCVFAGVWLYVCVCNVTFPTVQRNNHKMRCLFVVLLELLIFDTPGISLLLSYQT